MSVSGSSVGLGSFAPLLPSPAAASPVYDLWDFERILTALHALFLLAIALSVPIALWMAFMRLAFAKQKHSAWFVSTVSVFSLGFFAVVVFLFALVLSTID
jgi:hypothetical protein